MQKPDEVLSRFTFTLYGLNQNEKSKVTTVFAKGKGEKRGRSARNIHREAEFPVLYFHQFDIRQFAAHKELVEHAEFLGQIADKQVRNRYRFSRIEQA
jgi:hypothetical protein